MPTTSPDQPLVVEQAADRLQVKPRTIEELCRRGDLKSIFLGKGRHRRILESDLAEFLASRSRAA